MNEEKAGESVIDPLEQWLGYQLRRVSAAAMAELAPQIANEGFSPSLAAVLLMIEANPGRTQANIGRALAIKRANIAPMIAKLDDQKLIEKRSLNGRSFGLFVTRRGRSQTKRLAGIFAAHEAQTFSELSRSERRQLAGLLEKVRDRQAWLT